MCNSKKENAKMLLEVTQSFGMLLVFILCTVPILCSLLRFH